MDFVNMFQTFGFPIACVVCLGVYIANTQKQAREDNANTQKQAREDNAKREELYREDTKEREERLLLQLGEMSSTNKMLLETNAVLAKDINTKLDKIIEEVNER